MKKKIIWLLISYVVIYIAGMITLPIARSNKAKDLQERVIYEVRIDAKYINLRPEIDLNSKVIMKVYKGEKYKVVEYYEGNSYNWYRVIYEDYKTGWIASGKEIPWVEIVEGE